MKFYVAVASAIAAKNHCKERGLRELAYEWNDYIGLIVREHAPSGSGFDSGTDLNEDATSIGGNKPQRLVFDTSFHHMSEHGYYDGWTHHQVWIYPWFDGFSVRTTGRDRNNIKDFIADTFSLLGNVEVKSLADYRVAQKEKQVEQGKVQS